MGHGEHPYILQSVKSEVRRADPPGVVPLPPAAWAGIALVAAAAILGVLHTLAAAIRNEQSLRDLRERATALRNRYTAQQPRANEPVIVVDEAPPEEDVPELTAAA